MRRRYDDERAVPARDPEISVYHRRIVVWAVALWAFAIVLGLTVARLAKGAETPRLLGALPVYVEDRKPELSEAKQAQLSEATRAIESAVDGVRKWPGERRQLTALLAAWGNHETHFSLRIGRGECRARECDPDRKGVQRAHSYWQLHERTCSSREAWLAARTDVELAAREAARAAVRYRWQCFRYERDGRDWVRMMFSSLAARGCFGSFADLNARVATYRRLVGGGGGS